jgi:hypothetical protein
MREGVTHLILAPAAGVTDLDEWYGRLSAVVGIRDDARWHCESRGIAADLPSDEAERVLFCARSALGEALEARSGDSGATVIVTDAVGGRPIDE